MRHSRFSSPGRHGALLKALPADIPALTAAVRNLIVHYRASGLTFTGDRFDEVNSRWVERMLDADQGRFPMPLQAHRPMEERIVGCCRDFTLMTVAALREHGIAARSRVGFASYFTPGWNHDHVIAEYWNGERWVWVDAEPDPQDGWGFDIQDIPPGGPHFVNAARAWTAFRRGEIDPDVYGVAPELPYRGDWFLYDYVFVELAHRMGDESLLWDAWGAMSGDMAKADLSLADEIAALVIRADSGDASADRELTERYPHDERLHLGDSVLCLSPDGRKMNVDLVRASES